MELTIQNNTMTLVNQTGTKQEWNITYGSFVYDRVWNYIEVKDISDTAVQIRIDNITKFNGVAGQPTYAAIVTALEAETQA
jgi:hypothetical protein